LSAQADLWKNRRAPPWIRSLRGAEACSRIGWADLRKSLPSLPEISSSFGAQARAMIRPADFPRASAGSAVKKLDLPEQKLALPPGEPICRKVCRPRRFSGAPPFFSLDAQIK
jgi:hypothetical protein